MKILVIGGTGHVSRLVHELGARGVDVRVLARQRPRPGTLRGKVEVAVGDLTDPPAIEAAFKAVEKMFLLNAVNAPAHVGVGRIPVGAASGHWSCDLLLDFTGQPVPQRSAFRRQNGSGKRTAKFWRAVYRHPRGLLVQNERRSKARRTAKKSSPGTCRSSRRSAQPIRMPCARSDDPARTKL
jgi:hypothetical protein